MTCQMLPSLTQSEYDALKADIAARGVMVPIEKDEHGNTLDGFHREQICRELGLTDYPVTLRYFSTEDEKIHHAITVNLARRHLKPEQRRDLVLTLTQLYNWSPLEIAEVVGVSDDTVRRDLGSVTANAVTELPPTTTGKDGKEYPRRKPKTVTAKNQKQAEKALDALQIVGGNDGNDLQTADEIIREAKDTVREQNRAQVESIAEPPQVETVTREVKPGEWYRLGDHVLFCGDSSSDEFTGNAPMCPFAFADPPYNVDKADWDNGFIWAHDWLTERAQVVAVTPGTKEMQRFFKVCAMPYKWVFWAWIDNGMTVGSMGFQNTLFALLFAKESIYRNVQDGMRLSIDLSQSKESKHPTRKPAAFVARLVQIYTDENDFVIDPFLGSGTTLFICDEMNRKAFTAEMNPEYCAEIIERWERKHDAKAVRIHE